MSKDTGGQAFPNEGFNGWGEPCQGMTLRDYFAAHAPITIADVNEAFSSAYHRNPIPCERMEMLADMRGEYADAMLAERAK